MTSEPTSRRYARAPIVEATIEVLIAPEQPHDQVLAALTSAAPVGYRSEPIIEHSLMVTADKDLQKQDQVHLGNVHHDVAGNYVAQFRVNGMSFTRISAYDTFDVLLHDFKAMWPIYRPHNPGRILRIGLRYINRLDIPQVDGFDFDHYLTFFAHIPASLPQTVASYFSKTALPFLDQEALVTITQATVPPLAPNHISVLLDIDAIKDAKTGIDDEIWEILPILRGLKNKAFLASITERTEELIDNG